MRGYLHQPLAVRTGLEPQASARRASSHVSELMMSAAVLDQQALRIGRGDTTTEGSVAMPKDVVANDKLSKAEQADLLKVIRGRERVAKFAAAQRAAELRTDFEAQISKIIQFRRQRNLESRWPLRRRRPKKPKPR